MNLTTKLATAAIMLGSVSMAQATSYSVEGIFTEPMAMNGTQTVFNGTFDWDTSLDFTTNSNNMGLMGMMNSAMGVMPGMPNLSLTNHFVTSMDGSVVTASVFLKPGTDVFRTGGYDASEDFMGLGMYGVAPVSVVGTDTGNAYFTFSFDTAGSMVNPTGLTSTMQYGDCTSLGLMNSMCMTGFGVQGMNSIENGSMDGYASSLMISEVSAVPVPAAAWLFGGALISLFGANRRKSVLPA